MENKDYSMGRKGYFYAPEQCMNKTAACKLHVVFHGCSQTIGDIGMDYVTHTGYNELADTNNLVILYP